MTAVADTSFAARARKSRSPTPFSLTSSGPGEREAVALALDLPADWLILDDRAARRYAAGFGLTVIGTVRILEIAREGGLVDRVTPLLERLQADGFQLSQEIVALVRAAERDLSPDPSQRGNPTAQSVRAAGLPTWSCRHSNQRF